MLCVLFSFALFFFRLILLFFALHLVVPPFFFYVSQSCVVLTLTTFRSAFQFEFRRYLSIAEYKPNCTHSAFSQQNEIKIKATLFVLYRNPRFWIPLIAYHLHSIPFCLCFLYSGNGGDATLNQRYQNVKNEDFLFLFLFPTSTPVFPVPCVTPITPRIFGSGASTFCGRQSDWPTQGDV